MRAFVGTLFAGCLLQVCAAARVSETYVQTDEHAKGSFEEDGFMIAALSAADVAAPELVTGHGVKLAPVV